MTGPDLGGSMDRVEADLGVFMDRIEAAGVALVGGSDLRISLDTAEARAAPLRCGIVRRGSLTQVRVVLFTQDSQLSGFLKALMYASFVAFFTLLTILDRET